MTTKLTKLPATREAELLAIRDKWLAIGLRTGPGDRERAWDGIKRAYRIAGRREPRWWIWTRSPLEMLEAAEVVRAGALRAQVRAQVSDQVLEQVRAQVIAQVHARVSAQVYAQVSNQVSDQVYDQVRDQVYAQVRDQVYAQVNAKPTPDVDLFSWWFPGSLGSWWISLYESLREWCDFARLEGLIQVAESCGWAITLPDLVIFSAPPTVIARDERNRLHSETGAAVLFADGFGVWAWHGVRIPREWIEQRATLDPALALTWQNVEQRRALAEIVGWERVLEKTSAKCIQSDEWGELLEVTLPDAGKSRFVRVVCGTGRVFAIPVAQECETALDAVAWTYQMTANEYKKLEIRT